MSQDNVEALKRILEAGSRGDFETMIEHLDPAVEWRSAILSPIRGQTAVVHGHRGVPRMFQDFYETFSESGVDLSEVRDLGDRVVAIGRIRTRGKESGAETETPWSCVADFKDGRAVRMRTYLEPEAALAAAGLRGWDVRPEAAEDFDAIRDIHERAFEPSGAEADLVDALRDAGAHVPELCHVALAHDGSIAGHIAFSRARLQSGPEVLALAPMAVLPEHQRSGAGSALVTEALRRAGETDYPLVIVVGHPDYYPRFGFEPADALGLEVPFELPPEAWMAYRLPSYTPAATGTVIYPQAFAEVT
jgi:putative acetyltransferase